MPKVEFPTFKMCVSLLFWGSTIAFQKGSRHSAVTSLRDVNVRTWCIEAKIFKVMTQGRVKSAAWEPNKKPCFNGFKFQPPKNTYGLNPKDAQSFTANNLSERWRNKMLLAPSGIASHNVFLQMFSCQNMVLGEVPSRGVITAEVCRCQKKLFEE